MFLKKKEIQDTKFLKTKIKKILYVIPLVFFFITVSSVFIFFSSGFWKHNKNEIINRLDLYGIKNIFHTPEIISYIIKYPFYSKDKIYLDVNFEDQIILNENRKKKLKNLSNELSVINKNEKVFVNAQIKFNKSKKFKSKIRIKGDRKIHFEDPDKTSYFIKIRGDNKISGLNEFSIIKPRARNYLNEWIFHQLLKEADLPHIRYEFALVYINGTSNGLYAIEEGYTEQLTERNNLRYGPIFSVNEDLGTWAENTLPDLYNKKFWNKTEERKYISDYAASKLLNFFKGNLNLEDVMDIDKWSSYFAIIDLTESYHGARVKSVKFYYNPLTTKFEPIGFDAHYIKTKDKKMLSESYLNHDKIRLTNFVKQFFDNEKFFLNYLKKLEKFSSKDFLNNFFDKKNDDIKKINSLIYSDYFLNDYIFFFGPGIYYFDKERFFKRSKYITDFLTFNEDRLSFYRLNDDYYLMNNNSLPYLKINSIKCDEIFSGEIENKLNKVFNKNNLINISNLIRGNNCNQVSIDNIDQEEFKLNLINYTKFKINENVDKSTFRTLFDVDDKNKIIKLRKKKVKILKNIFLPKAYKLILYPGDKIEILNNSFIFSKSHWIAKGSKQDPIIISGNENNNGGGIYVFDNKEKNIIKNVIFKYFAGTSSQNEQINKNFEYFKKFNLLGSVNFYNVDIHLEDALFDKILSEDALNIVSSNKFLLKNVYFKNINSDAIDIDFGIGKMENIYSHYIKNDALDFSKSNVKLKNIYAKNVGDKIISAGENSKLIIENLYGENSFIGIATKDGSSVKLTNYDFKNNKYNFASYIKKNGYDSPIIKIYNKDDSEFLDKKILKDKISKIFFNDIKYALFKKNSLIVKEIYK